MSDAFSDLQDIVLRLKRLTDHADGVVSIEINAEAWAELERKIELSKSYRDAMRFKVDDGRRRGRREFELMGVKFVSYCRKTGLYM